MMTFTRGAGAQRVGQGDGHGSGRHGSAAGGAPDGPAGRRAGAVDTGVASGWAWAVGATACPPATAVTVASTSRQRKRPESMFASLRRAGGLYGVLRTT